MRQFRHLVSAEQPRPMTLQHGPAGRRLDGSSRRRTHGFWQGVRPRPATLGACGSRGGEGPLRRLIARSPPDFTSLASLRKARSRWVGRTCCQTALSRTRSKLIPNWPVWFSSGSWSSSQRTRGSGWRCCASDRIALDGSTATTSCPRVANHAASRPDPALTSSTVPGASPRSPDSQPYSFAGSTSS